VSSYFIYASIYLEKEGKEEDKEGKEEEGKGMHVWVSV